VATNVSVLLSVEFLGGEGVKGGKELSRGVVGVGGRDCLVERLCILKLGSLMSESVLISGSVPEDVAGALKETRLVGRGSRVVVLEVDRGFDVTPAPVVFAITTLGLESWGCFGFDFPSFSCVSGRASQNTPLKPI